MKNISGISILFSVLLFLSTCKKTEEHKPPVITVMNPTTSEHFNLPVSIPVILQIDSDEALNVISLRIDNEDQIPLSVPVFLYPDADEFNFEVELQVDFFDVEANEDTYLHIKAENRSGISHEFVKLDFFMPDVIFKGFYLISRPSVSQTKVQFYDTAFVATDYMQLPYEYVDVGVSYLDDMLLILTKSPDRLQAFRFPEVEPRWQVTADLPNPAMYSLNLNDGIIYTSTGNGQLVGYRTDNGHQQFNSHLVFDSVPQQIGVTEDYVIADYRSLVSPERSWMVFYKSTAGFVHQHANQLVVHDFYPALSKNNLLAFGNIGQLGVIQFFDVEQNNNLISFNFTTGRVGASCKMEQGFFLVAVGKEIWEFNEMQQSAILLTQTTEDVIDLQYDLASQQIYIVSEYSLVVFNITADTLIKEIVSSTPIRALRLQYGYQSK